MPEPIQVDFRKKRQPPKPAPKAKPASRAPSGEKAVNWRAVPKFLLFFLAMALLFAALNFGMKAVGLS